MIEFGTKHTGENHIHRFCCYAVIINDDGLIGMVETPKGFFLIGGGIDEGEEPMIALAREALEETGMKIEILEKIGEAADHDAHTSEDGNCYSRSSHFYKARLLDKATEPIELDHELRWVTLDEALENLFFEGQRWAVKQCF